MLRANGGGLLAANLVTSPAVKAFRASRARGRACVVADGGIGRDGWWIDVAPADPVVLSPR